LLKVSTQSGCQYFCVICQTPILELSKAWGLHRPLTGPTDTTDVLIMHEGCREASLTQMLLPKSVKRPLVAVFDMADEAANRG
jgi:hypothetical protein